jgi:conjugative transfer pilus assembly protein TraH
VLFRCESCDRRRRCLDSCAKVRLGFTRPVMLLLIALTLFPLSPIARADSQALFNKLMGEYINATPGQVFETQTRGGITLGSVSARSAIDKPKLVSLTPPSIRGTCGGFDFVAGSFSFINSQQLQQYLRSIASNALNYAFTLALEGVCPMCEQKLEKLRDWTNDMNKNLQDSCQWATSLVNSTGLNTWAQAEMNSAKQKNAAAGVSSDIAEANQNFTTELDNDAKTGKPTPVNATWSAMQKSQTASWFGSIGDVELQEIIMSVTGTLIKSPVDGSGAGCTNTDSAKEYCYSEKLPLLDVNDFIEGSDSGQVSVYQCRDNTTDCLDPEVVQKDWPGLRSRIRDILFGPAPGYTGGLIYKLRDPTATYTDAEKGFIEGAPLPVYNLLQNVAQYQGSLITMGQQLQTLVTVQVARNVVLEMIDVVRKSFGAQSIQMSELMAERLRDRVAEFHARVSYEDREFEAMLALLQEMEIMARRVRGEQPQKAGGAVGMRPKS